MSKLVLDRLNKLYDDSVNLANSTYVMGYDFVAGLQDKVTEALRLLIVEEENKK